MRYAADAAEVPRAQAIVHRTGHALADLIGLLAAIQRDDVAAVQQQLFRLPAHIPGEQHVKVSGGSQDGAVFSALLNSKSFQGVVRSAVLDVLRSPEGQELLRQAVRKELGK